MKPLERLHELLAINRAIVSSLSYDEVLQLVVRKTADFLSADACVLLLAGEGDQACIVASVGIDPDRAHAFAVPLDERITVALGKLCLAGPKASLLAAPVLDRDHVRGVLAVCRADPGAARPDDELVLSALADQSAIALAHAACHTEITRDLDTSRRELEQRAAELAEANEAKIMFFNVLSHELRTPLGAILHSVEVMNHAASTAVQRERALETITRNVRHQAQLVDDLLDLSRLIRRKTVLERSPVDLREVARAQIEVLEDQARQQGVQLELAAAELPVIVDGDRARLGQVLANLLTNAIKFSPRDTRVRISVWTDAGRGLISVRDQGIGIPAHLLARLFEPFVQVDSSLGRTRGGLGIGLPIARALIEQHGGTIKAASDGPDRGSRFEVSLPLAGTEAPDETAPPEPAHPEAAAGRMVLLVEDNQDLRDTLSDLLQMVGQQVIAAADGRTALELARAHPPEVALIDIGLPDIDGYELARRLRRLPGLEQVRLVAITGYATDEHRAMAADAGFDEHMTKPVDLDSLLRALERVRV